MIRGYFSGVMMGLIVSLCVAGIVSIMFGERNAPKIAISPSIDETAIQPNAVNGVETETTPDRLSITPQQPQDDVTRVAVAGNDLSQQPQIGVAEGPEAPNVSEAEEDIVESEMPISPAPQDTKPANAMPLITPEESEPVIKVSMDRNETAAVNSLPALKAFSVPFTNADNKPLMSIVLIDDGVDLENTAVGLPALSSFSGPVSFAVDTNLPDAAARMNIYRKEGFEVMAMIDLPNWAKPEDAKVILNSALGNMTQVVGVIEGVGTGIQDIRDASENMIQVLKNTGHGFVLQSNGLNFQTKVAQAEGVPTATVFRDFDNAGQTATVIRRFLDQAAFRARQEGAIIMLGRLRSETISALLLWGLQDRASRVAIAPISAVLMR